MRAAAHRTTTTTIARTNTISIPINSTSSVFPITRAFCCCLLSLPCYSVCRAVLAQCCAGLCWRRRHRGRCPFDAITTADALGKNGRSGPSEAYRRYTADYRCISHTQMHMHSIQNISRSNLTNLGINILHCW